MMHLHLIFVLGIILDINVLFNIKYLYHLIILNLYKIYLKIR